MQLEGEEACEGIDPVYKVKMHNGQGACPALLVVLNMVVQGLDHRFVSTFAGVISLRMVSSQYFGLDASQAEKGLSEMRDEQFVTVRDNVKRKPIVAVPFIEEQFGKAFSREVGVCWNEVNVRVKATSECHNTVVAIV